MPLDQTQTTVPQAALDIIARHETSVTHRRLHALIEGRDRGYDTGPRYEALVGQTVYVGMWACGLPNLTFWEIDLGPVESAGWLEDGVSRRRGSAVYCETREEALNLVGELSVAVLDSYPHLDHV